MAEVGVEIPTLEPRNLIAAVDVAADDRVAGGTVSVIEHRSREAAAAPREPFAVRPAVVGPPPEARCGRGEVHLLTGAPADVADDHVPREVVEREPEGIPQAPAPDLRRGAGGKWVLRRNPVSPGSAAMRINAQDLPERVVQRLGVGPIPGLPDR